ncbi:MAG: iron-siderophore ABC transporter substrate-binding protein [Salinibacterium sp.]|nr:iron-siderophore ABC transporter substrate-binding protein [Salinibacterium sp.]
MRLPIRRSAAVIAAVAASVIVLSGCASTPSTEPSAADLLGSVDTMFGAVDVPQPADGELTVVALGWSDAEMALALGVTPVAVVDWQGFGAENKGVGPWATPLFGDVTPEIIERGAETLNFEQIELLEPDLILNTRSANDEQEYKRLSQIAPTVYAPEGTAAFATDWATQLTSVSAALGLSDQGGKLIDATEQLITDAAAANPDFKGKTIASAAKFGDAYGAYLAGDGRFDILIDLGFTATPTIDALESSGFYAAVSAENVRAFDADVLVVIPIGFTLVETEADPLLASLTVVKDDRAVVIDPDSELAGAYSAASVLSIPVVLDQLVPELAAATR